jgi:hypothetical protein
MLIVEAKELLAMFSTKRCSLYPLLQLNSREPQASEESSCPLAASGADALAKRFCTMGANCVRNCFLSFSED